MIRNIFTINQIFLICHINCITNYIQNPHKQKGKTEYVINNFNIKNIKNINNSGKNKNQYKANYSMRIEFKIIYKFF